MLKLLAKSFAKKTTFANSENKIAGSHVGTLATFGQLYKNYKRL